MSGLFQFVSGAGPRARAVGDFFKDSQKDNPLKAGTKMKELDGGKVGDLKAVLQRDLGIDKLDHDLSAKILALKDPEKYKGLILDELKSYEDTIATVYGSVYADNYNSGYTEEEASQNAQVVAGKLFEGIKVVSKIYPISDMNEALAMAAKSITK